jgi:outer membrane protein TolC
MLIGPFLRWIILVEMIAFPCVAATQEIVPVELSLEKAIEIALSNNPGFQATRNDGILADWEVRSAYGSLIPSASTNFGVSWQGAGEQVFGSLTAGQLGFMNQPSFIFSNYQLGLSYDINGTTLLAPRQKKANRAATQAQMAGAESNLIFEVTQRYIEVLRQTEQVQVSEQQHDRARFNLRLAKAQLEAGAATPVDVAQADVALGRAEVTILQTTNALETAHIRLLQHMGTSLEDPFVLTTTFLLSEPLWSQKDLYTLGTENNTTLRALKAGRSASSYSVKIAKSAYLPTLSFRAGISGFTRQASNTEAEILRAQTQNQGLVKNCLFTNDIITQLPNPPPSQNCSSLAFTEKDAQNIEARNRSFPWDFTNQPPSAGLTISLPLFQGLNRKHRVAEAQVALDDLDHNVREQELALKADIVTILATVRTAYQAALIEEQNQVVADEQLRLARERFSVGLTGFLELLDAETLKVEADREQISAIFAYHDFLVNLEAVVGMSLRTQ